MRAQFLLERRQESRLTRFTFGMALGAAIVLHAAAMWLPRASYAPVLEVAKLRPAVVGRPFRGAAPPRRVVPVAAPESPPPAAARPPPKEAPMVADQALPGASQPTPSTAPAPAPESASSTAGPADGGDQGLRGSGAETRGEGAAVVRQRQTGDLSQVGARGTGGTGSAPPAAAQERQARGKDDWTAVLAALESRGKELTDKPTQQTNADRSGAKAPVSRGPGKGQGRGSGDGDGDGDGERMLQDRRIRTTVASYPPSSLDGAHPAIPYPDLRLHKRDLKAGVCRVYYRVWVDSHGRIVNSQLKTPETQEEQRRYAPFVEAVVESVRTWSFDRQDGEIHIDVLFTIE